ncbi:hypothetical protein D5S18_08645 [Nocardia panacis]|uniref:Transmembrane protein n=1 Tax=Nocardia panacis TaxID=2340916 RepID=A0A3A4KM33_9NOCA|nr:gephyrin-like molybdotransferase receptor GlpR [Nocardia panacis]RJO76387.1 hypothetical protein D5S18_08645 [Nocardia panacis]
MPNSILWIGLVVLWVFVLFPILADRHPRIRQTTDAALATRVLHRGGSKRRAKKGPATGHDSDPDYQPIRAQRRFTHSDDAEDRMTLSADEPVTEADKQTTSVAEDAAVASPGSGDAGVTSRESVRRAVDTGRQGVAAELAASDEADKTVSTDDHPDQTDGAANDDGAATGSGRVIARSRAIADDHATADVRAHKDDRAIAAPCTAEDSGAANGDHPTDDAKPADESATAVQARIPPVRSAAPARIRDEDESDSPASDPDDFVPNRRGRGGFDPEADAIARAARYTFRQRAVLGLILSALIFGGVAVALNPLLWWACGATTLILIGYLAYLRKQVRMEEDIRRRRAARLPRAQQTVGSQPDRRAADTMDRDTARALRRRSTLLDADDEDPTFEHLDPFDPAAARALRGRSGDLRRGA